MVRSEWKRRIPRGNLKMVVYEVCLWESNRSLPWASSTWGHAPKFLPGASGTPTNAGRVKHTGFYIKCRRCFISSNVGRILRSLGDGTERSGLYKCACNRCNHWINNFFLGYWVKIYSALEAPSEIIMTAQRRSQLGNFPISASHRSPILTLRNISIRKRKVAHACKNYQGAATNVHKRHNSWF